MLTSIGPLPGLKSVKQLNVVMVALDHILTRNMFIGSYENWWVYHCLVIESEGTWPACRKTVKARE